MSAPPELTLERFLAEAEHYRLGHLPTEQPHPKTAHLASWSREDLPRAVAVLREVDQDALAMLSEHAPLIEELAAAVVATLEDGGRVFLCGCGATGRLSLSLETFWRQRTAGSPLADRVVSLMAGGDTALIASIEGFEDFPALGARHLDELGFGALDLLIACTEGGETPWVIGATRRAAEVSRRRPWFLYCNPDESLRGIARSAAVLGDPRIASCSLPTGPMALSGSTRMQASTVLMLAVGYALMQPGLPLRRRLARLADHVETVDVDALARLIEAESAAYEAGDDVLYETERYAITVLTDTTERSPTFNLASFENVADADAEPSLCYLSIPAAADAAEAWRRLLERAPRPLEWPGFEAVAGRERLLGFDFSGEAPVHRRRRLPNARRHRFAVGRVGDVVRLSLGDEVVEGAVGDLSPLEEQTLLKLVLNVHSTLVMGRLGRYESNVMTWVRPSNRKLVDRAIRYVEQLLRVGGATAPSYEALARALFEAMAELGSTDSIVLKTVQRVLSR